MIINREFAEWLLKKHKFMKTPPELIEKLFLNGKEKTLSKDQYIYMEGDSIDGFYMLLSGKVEIYKNTDRFSNKIFGVLTKGDIFGVQELFLEEHSVSALAITPIEYISVDAGFLLDNYQEYKELIYDLFRQTSRMIAEMQRALCVESAEHKVTSYIYYLMVNSGIKVDKGIYIKKNLNNEKIASVLNITRETLSRVFTDLKNRLIIESNRDSITVLSPDLLKDLIVDDKKLAGFYGPTDICV